MSTAYHMKLDIAGALRNRDFTWPFTDEDGRRLSKREVETRLKYELAMGRVFLPIGDCPDFDPKTGCPGHEESA